jgi:hypothetical protein
MGGAGPTHLLKLCVGAGSVEDLEAWRDEWAAQERAAGRPESLLHVTRLWPKRAESLLAGGSLYWVIGGAVRARQRIIALEPVDEGDGIIRCGVRLAPAVTRTAPRPVRPFQGWRYLDAKDAPADLAGTEGWAELPPDLENALAEFGVAWRRS